MKHIRTIAAAVAGAAATALLFGVTAADAQGQVPANTIHGCLSTATRVITNVYTNPANGLNCPTGTSQVYWASGANSAGLNGLDVISVTASGSTANDPSTTVVNCPADHPNAIGGGAFGGGGEAGWINSSFPASPSSWEVVMAWPGVGGIPAKITVYAMCAK